jgi:hypothetical protein
MSFMRISQELLVAAAVVYPASDSTGSASQPDFSDLKLRLSVFAIWMSLSRFIKATTREEKVHTAMVAGIGLAAAAVTYAVKNFSAEAGAAGIV